MQNQKNQSADPLSAQAEAQAVKNCPSCGNLMVYDPQSQSMYCSACKTKVALDLETGAGVYEELDFDSVDESTLNYNWGSGKVIVRCKSCGAETVMDDAVQAQSCTFCGSSQVVGAPMEATDALSPTHLIPFVVSIKKAVDLFKGWLKGKFFVPAKCKKSVSADKLKGVYVPFWTFDAKTRGEFQAQYGVERQVVHTRTVVEDGKSKQETYIETVIDWYPTRGSYERIFDDVLISASKKTDSTLINEVEPFDFTKMLSYQPQFLAGFLAERYTIGLQDSWKIATQTTIKAGIEDTIENKVKAQHHTIHVQVGRYGVDYSDRTYKHILLPLWFSHYEYRGKQYFFIVNGQTGKVGGKAPTSVLKVLMCILGGAAILYFLYWLFTSM